ncbi:heat shock 70 kDa protein 12B-like isoform X2 [Ruditapes philippinarum]|nr:heat shock 70 kDa protein 12B-like isoform X2 [Ruditapes philippinarum]
METSRLALCLRKDVNEDSINMFCKLWQNSGVETISAPLNVIIKPDGKTLYCYGYDAEYCELELTNRYNQYYFFKDISIKLVKSFKENSDLHLKAKNGKTLPALKVFTLVVEFFKRESQRLCPLLLEGDKLYVIIVPEIFQEIGAIDFMRNAALEAGINMKQLIVVTEIDAVSLFHQKETHYKTSSIGKKFMIINAGSYFTTIAVHESPDLGIIKEYKGVEYKEAGNRLLKKAFKKFCTDIFGECLCTSFKTHSKQDWSELKIDFLRKALTFDLCTSDVFRLKFHYSFLNSLKKDITLHKFSPGNESIEGISITCDKVYFPAELIKKVIDPSVQQIISVIPTLADIDEIVVFGEFAKQPMLKNGVKTKFVNKNVVFYDKNTEAALKGAVIIGLGLGQIEKIDKARDSAIVAAIDFGTTYSGCAYSLRANFDADPAKAFTKKWNSGTGITVKTPTSILIEPDGKTVKAFGYEAEDEYENLAANDEHKDYFYFERFKMSLNMKLGKKLDRNMTLEDAMNRSLRAMDVFAMGIKFLKDVLLGMLCNKHTGNISLDDIHWVLTVPAIWTDGSKQFMREAAIMTGIQSKRLTIALEPEAASMFCRYLPIEATTSDTGVNISSLSIGAQYLVLDAGGGTIDITVHEVDNDNNIKEIHAASGSGWGGTIVDKEFESLLVTLVSRDVYEDFKRDNTDDWLDVWREFEVRKRTITTSSNSPLRIKLPSSLAKRYKLVSNEILANALKNSKYDNDIKIVKDKITFSPELARSWFRTSVESTVHMIKSILTSRYVNISAILMVGGFSECLVLQNAVKSAFKEIDVIVPEEASTCVLKGATIFGHLPKVIIERVLRHTYGIETFEKFVLGRHPPSKCIITDNGMVCQKVFSKHAEIDQKVKVGEPQVWRTYSPQYKSQKQMSFSVCASDKPNPIYTDEGCIHIGTLQIDLDDHDGALDREVLVAFTFSGTEIVVQAKDRKTGNESFVAVDFLG